MFRKGNILSLTAVLILMVVAAVTVNKSIFGHRITHPDSSTVTSDLPGKAFISEMPDGDIIVHTADLPGVINGYAGPVPLDIYISEGKIAGIRALPNAETPSFFSRASELLSAWNGMTPEDALKTDVDAVSGATFSSAAIINNVNVGLAQYQGTVATKSASIPVKIWIAFAVTLAACFVPLFVRSRIYNNFQLLANVIVLGFWCGQFLDYSLMLKYISQGFSLPGGLVAIAMLIAAFIYPLFGKPQHYCNHICPLGSAQILVAQLCNYKIKLSRRVLNLLDIFRRLLWAVLMLLLWMDCLTGWMDLELFQAFQFESASWGIIIVAAIFVALSAVISRPYCRFVCPTGSLFKQAENIN